LIIVLNKSTHRFPTLPASHASAVSNLPRDKALGDNVLGEQRRGFSGVITGLSFGPTGQSGGVSSLELERRLLEMGFVEGARVEILHEGFIGRDPIAVKLDDMRVALRRREARCVRVRAGA